MEQHSPDFECFQIRRKQRGSLLDLNRRQAQRRCRLYLVNVMGMDFRESVMECSHEMQAIRCPQKDVFGKDGKRLRESGCIAKKHGFYRSPRTASKSWRTSFLSAFTRKATYSGSRTRRRDVGW
jgi:hypothetical protein